MLNIFFILECSIHILIAFDHFGIILKFSQIFIVANYKRLQVISEDVAAKDSEGRVIESQLLPIADANMHLRNYHVKAYLGNNPTATPKFWLAFPVSVPPFGFSTYIISTSTRAGWLNRVVSCLN